MFAQKLSSQLKPLTKATGVCLVSAILRIPLTLPELHDFALTSLTQSQILILVYYGVGPVVCFLFYGIWRISASTAGMTVVPVPVASVLTSALFLMPPSRQQTWRPPA
ncbi:EamA family transporter [Candidatus Pantoea bituminis]|uniref:EamA family transporter n=1 Tax=Candidatus Pantoea bituminis TaxID=2831036 RepID=UPI00351CC656